VLIVLRRIFRGIFTSRKKGNLLFPERLMSRHLSVLHSVLVCMLLYDQEHISVQSGSLVDFLVGCCVRMIYLSVLDMIFFLENRYLISLVCYLLFHMYCITI